ncbi:copper resistance CopC/CopD family protein [Rugosimonospora africana]|uniref:Transport integral membrane protein n=1 Tax=Rugosimonospora africana TaxID=556532 RepID=A0A8J3VN71_9ACTN|nr:transport integral membrane protein [Rugosimonospora africana]
MTPRRLLVALAGVLLGVSGVFTLPAGPASAHAALIRTSPTQGAVVQQSPREVVITFSEMVAPVREKIKVIGPDGKRADRGNPTISGDDLHIPLRSETQRGTYVVGYRVISADGHPVGAAFTYSVGAPSQNTATADVSGGGRTDTVVADGVSVANFLGYAGLILSVGPALVLMLLWPRRLERRGPTRLAYGGLSLLALATVLQLYLEVPYSIGTGLFGISGSDLGNELVDRYGIAHLVRLAVIAVAAVLLRPVLTGGGARWQRWTVAVLGAAIATTFGIAGHPSTSVAPALTVIADAVHLGGVAIWIGGLIALVAFLLRRANPKELGAILPVWSDWAAASVAALVLAGTAQALVQIGSFGALLHTTYGKLVLVKVGLLAVVLVVAAFSRRLVRRGMQEPDGVPDRTVGMRLRRTVLAEVVGAVVIIGVASVLVQTTPARTQAAVNGSTNQSGVVSTTMTSSLYQLQFDIEPAQTGPNDIHLYAYTPQGAPLKVVEWKVSAGLPAQGIEPIAAVLTPIADFHAIGQITLPAAGQWNFSFTLRTTEIDEATVTTTVKVSQ